MVSARAIRVLIIDDEPLARAHVRSLLGDDPGVTIVGECGNGADAVASIRDLKPDLVLLDIQMPELDGFGLVREVGADAMPATIFITAYDEYALKAFEVYAVDYLLKPVDRQRFAQAIARAKERINSVAGATSDAAGRLQQAMDYVAKQRAERIAIKVDGRTVLLRAQEIDWIDAEDDYVRIHAGKSNYLIRATLGSIEQKLPPGFMRIHRSTIVNMDRIKEIQPYMQGDYVVTLADGTKRHTGRSYRPVFAAFLRAFTADNV